MTDNDNTNDNWLTPKEAAAQFGLQLRRVYRWIERGQVATQGEKGNIRVSAADIQALLEKRIASDVVNDVIGETKTTRREMGGTIAASLLDLSRERGRLQSELSDLQSARVQDARLIGQLEGRLQAVEGELTRLQTDNRQLQRTNSRAAWVIAGLVLALILVIILLVILKV